MNLKEKCRELAGKGTLVKVHCYVDGDTNGRFFYYLGKIESVSDDFMTLIDLIPSSGESSDGYRTVKTHLGFNSVLITDVEEVEPTGKVQPKSEVSNL